MIEPFIHDWIYRAKLVRAVDGDTIVFRVDLGFHVHTEMQFRLAGADTPEVLGVREGSEEYAAGVVASEFVKTWLEARGGNVLLRTGKRAGKYGRWLAEVYGPEGVDCLNEDLIESGHGKVYLSTTF